MAGKQLNRDRFIINAYCGPFGRSMHHSLIPEVVKDIIYQYCDIWWNGLDPSPIKISHFSYYRNGKPNLLYYESKALDKQRIILSSFANNSPFVYEYDIKNDKFNVLCKYPTNFDPECHAQAIDIKNECLYIFFGRNDNLGILNLINNEWDIKLYNNNNFNIHNVPHNVLNPTSCFIQSPIHQLHILKNKRSRSITTTDHYYYKSDEQIFVCTNCQNMNGQSGQIVYVEKLKKLLSIGLDIYYCDIVENADIKYIDNNYKWKIFDGLKLPFKAFKPQCIIAMNAILLVIKDRETTIYDHGEIYCVDIGDQNKTEYKWIKSDISIKKPKIKRMILANNNYIHFIDFYSDDDLALTHSKIHLSHLIPHHMFIKYASSTISPQHQ